MFEKKYDCRLADRGSLENEYVHRIMNGWLSPN